MLEITVVERLANADPSNLRLQRDLAGANDKVGEVQTALGDLTAALEITISLRSWTA